ncbi:MAG: hypothetical protein HZB33_00025 [Nitrospirae bacterium]|nr:hypothetical protein [Nitrospirota bacterium]
MIGIFIGILFLVYIIYALSIRLTINNTAIYSIVLMVFGVFSIGRLTYAGMDWRWQITSIVGYALGSVAVAKNNDKTFQESVLYALTLAMLLHVCAIFFPLDFISHGINTQTGMSVTRDEEVGIFFGRHTGFTGAPGLLSLFASVGLALGINLIIKEKFWPWCLLAGASLLCGFASGNRSFIFASVTVMILTFLFNVGRNGKRQSLVLVISILAVGIAGYCLYKYTSYGAFMYSRIYEDALEYDIYTRLYSSEVGISDILDVVARSPILGSIEFIPGTTETAIYSGVNWFQPHNSIVWIIGSRGVIAGIFFVAISILAAVNLLRRNSLQQKYPLVYSAFPGSVFLIGFIAGQVVSLSDTMLETGLMLFLLGTGLGSVQAGSEDA